MIYSIRSSARNVKRIKNYPLHKKVVQYIFLPPKNSAIIIFAQSLVKNQLATCNSLTYCRLISPRYLTVVVGWSGTSRNENIETLLKNTTYHFIIKQQNTCSFSIKILTAMCHQMDTQCDTQVDLCCLVTILVAGMFHNHTTHWISDIPGNWQN